MSARTVSRGTATPEDLPGWDPAAKLGVPGDFPFTRGIQPTMYRGRLWTMRQYAGFGTAEQSNARYRYLLAHGVNGLSVAFDLPTQMAYDSDHPLAADEDGTEGAPTKPHVHTPGRLDASSHGRVPASMTTNDTARIAPAL